MGETLLPVGTSYAEVYARFRWQLPTTFNIGVDVCDRHADDPSRLAMIYEDDIGQVSTHTFAECRAHSNQLAQALEQFRKSVVIREALAAGQPLNVRDQRQLMIAYSKVGELLGPAPPSLQDAAGAVASFNKMLAIADKLAAADRHDKRAAFDHAWPW